MTQKIAHIVLFSLFAVFVTNYVVEQIGGLKKDNSISFCEQLEEESLNEDDRLATLDYFVLNLFFKRFSTLYFSIEQGNLELNTQTKGFSPHGFHASAYLDLCVFRI